MVETTEIAIKSMDSLLRHVLSNTPEAVLSETPEADRRKLISICLKSIPNRMNFVECVTLVSILSKIGIVDINNIANDQIDFVKEGQDGDKYYIHYACDFTIDTDGRITELGIMHNESDDYDLPAIIAFLERLTFLMLSNCRSIPAELSNLPHLEKLHLNIFSLDLLENFPIQMKLKNLKILRVNSDVPLPASSRFLKWMTSQLPNLETLEFENDMENNDHLFIIDSLRTNNVCFHKSLKHLALCCCLTGQESFEILILEIVPKFRDLRSLDLSRNRIKSFLPIVDSIKNDRTFVPSKSLRVLNVRSNPVFKKMKDDPIETAAMLSFLGIFNTIHSFGERLGRDLYYDSDVEYALRINHAGRRIVVKVDGGSNNDDDRKAIIPIPLWPIILERAYEKSWETHCSDWESEKEKEKKKSATGIYYLLREVGPALLFGGQRRPNACILSKDGDGDGGVSLKRKDIITINERVSKTRSNNNNESSSS
ncbi:hypothetical protein FRACYDRAFT_256201 [Fragilariopsis cylindrus CCMP1102]|uniref:RNI-like protein n=1 Tax=Fragilariopsis cylindrus CCMP1102 TaxID=635003 RepID=A0A1E7EJU4_9STRA|nr:hypothetical protein FRACYDRAFT_256201 [Fragilariopsis cylindrus CCMP1102]|eukprot:OEU06156.1 hypothetical protein FRACYDRAFT_256201 [Fragilariopsis cylindrus CCMP1102]